MLSTLPKLADKAFILGFFLPVILFVTSLSGLFFDVRWISDTFQIASNTEDLAKLAFLILGLWALAVLMLLVNRLQYQVLEGYYWPLSKMEGLKARQLHSFNMLKSRIDALRAQRRANASNFSLQQEEELEGLGYEFRKNFPSDEQLLLPTRFGNVIRAFEQYSNDVYGADSVTLWPHMASVVPKEFDTPLEDARSQVNCLVNITYFGAIAGLVALARLLWGFGSAINASTLEVDLDRLLAFKNVYFFISAVAAGFISWISYKLAIDRAYNWGHMVKAAFDCYLPSLATRLGYKLPKTGDDRRKFWIAVCQRVLYHRPLRPEQWPQSIAAEKRVSDKKQDDEDRNADTHKREEQLAAEAENETETV